MKALEFAHPVEACDVDDHAALTEYRARLAEWYEWLDGDDRHAIWRQLWGLVWNDAVFRVLDESRGLAKEAGGDWAALNPLISGFIDQGYVSAAVLGVRRLTERPYKNPQRQVISLTRLLKDLDRNRHLITRQNFVCYDGLPFDVEEAWRRHWQQEILPNVGEGRCFSLPRGGPNDGGSADDRHRLFDLISAPTAEERSRKDPVDRKAIAACLGRVEAAGRDIGEFGNKFVAHAADRLSRGTLTAEQQGISIAKVERAIRRLVDVASRLSVLLFGINQAGALPIPSYGLLARLNQPWLPRDMLSRLQRSWDSHERRAELWTKGIHRRLRPTVRRGAG